MRKRLLAGMLAAFILSIGAVVLMLSVGDVEPNTLQFELAKALLQVGLLSAGGAALSLLTFEYQQERQLAEKTRDEEQRKAEKDRDEKRRLAEKDRDEKRRLAEKVRDEERRRQEYRQELLTATLARANATYTDVKRARRLLRGLAVAAEDSGQPVAIIASHYDEQTLAIIDAQLVFENLADDVRTNATSFTSAHALAKELDGIEDYLNELISEYEDERRNFVGKPPQRSLDRLPRLDKFLASPHRGEAEKFKQGFRRLKLHFIKAQYLVRKDLHDLAYATEDRDSGGDQPLMAQVDLNH